METDQKPVIWTIVIASIILLVGGMFAVGNIGNKLSNGLDVMNEKLSGLSIDEQVIANGIVAGIVMPTMPEMPEYDTEKIDDVWKAMFGVCGNTLEIDAEVKVKAKVIGTGADMREYVEDNLEDFDDFTTLTSVFTLDDEETEVTILDLGECEINSITYNEDEDRKVTVVLEYDFEYTKDTGVVGDAYRGTLYVTGEYVYDVEDSESEVELSYSL